MSDLLGVGDDLDEVPGDGAVGVRVVERGRPARVAHAARPPDAVNVLVRRLRRKESGFLLNLEDDKVWLKGTSEVGRIWG